MPQASIKRLIECKKEDLISLVLDIEKYPEFVPFCFDAKIYEKKDLNNQVLIIADLTIGKGPFKDTYKSDVRYDKKNHSIYVTNLNGPLKYLKNRWHFIQIGKKTEISFDVDFELENKFLNTVMAKSFNYGLSKIADAFEERANILLNRS